MFLKGQVPTKPERSDFGLQANPDLPVTDRDFLNAAIRKQIDSWQLDLDQVAESTKINLHNQMEKYLGDIRIAFNLENTEDVLYLGAAKTIGIMDNLLDVLTRERAYLNAMSRWKSYQDWLAGRNKKRAELEKKYGYDTKFAQQAYRLIVQGKELLTEGKLRVRRPDAEPLLAIRNGCWTFEEWEKRITNLDKELQGIFASGTSPLPKKADREKLDKLCIELVEDSYVTAAHTIS